MRSPAKHIGAALAALAIAVCGINCSSDPDTPLGHEFIEEGVIDADPGDVFQDTLLLQSGDASILVSNYGFRSTTMELGRKDDIETWPVFRIDLSKASSDKLREVESASFVLTLTSGSDSLRAVFIELGDSLSEADTLKTITLTDTVPDGTGTGSERVMKAFPRTYPLPPQLVQAWIRGTKRHNGIAVVLTDTTTTKRLGFGAKEAGGNSAQLKVIFKDHIDTTPYQVAADGTYAKDLKTTNDLLLSDTGARRVYVPLDLTAYDPKTVLHEAQLVLHMVPGSLVSDSSFAVNLYVPNGLDIQSPDVLSGTALPSSQILPSVITSGVLTISIQYTLARLISEGTDKSALVLRFETEGMAVRRWSFYTSGAPDSLKPAVRLTYSTAPTFPK